MRGFEVEDGGLVAALALDAGGGGFVGFKLEAKGGEYAGELEVACVENGNVSCGHFSWGAAGEPLGDCPGAEGGD